MRRLSKIALRNLILATVFLGLTSFTLIELQIVVAIISTLQSPCDQSPMVMALVKEDLVDINNGSGTTTLQDNLLIYEIDPETWARTGVVYSAPILQQNTTVFSTYISVFLGGPKYYLIQFRFPEAAKNILVEGKYYDFGLEHNTSGISDLLTLLSTGNTGAQLSNAYYFSSVFKFLDCSKTYAECNSCDNTEAPCNPSVNLFDGRDNGTFESETPANGGFQQSLASYMKKNTSFFIRDPNYSATGSFYKMPHTFEFTHALTVAPGTSVNVNAWIKVDPSAYMGESGGNTGENLRSYDIGLLRPEGLAIEQGWTIDGSKNLKRWQPFQVKLSNLGTTDVILSQLVFTSNAQVSVRFSENITPITQGGWATDFLLDDITVSCTKAPFTVHALNLNADFKTTSPTKFQPKRDQFIAGHTEYVDLGVHKDYLSAFPYYCQSLLPPESEVVLRSDDCEISTFAPTNVCEDFVVEFDLKVNGYLLDFPTTSNGQSYREPVLSRLSADGSKGWKFSVVKSGFTNSANLDLEFSWTFDNPYRYNVQGPFLSDCDDKETNQFVIVQDLATITPQVREAEWVHVTLRINKLDTDYSGTQHASILGKNKVTLTIAQLEGAPSVREKQRILPDDIEEGSDLCGFTLINGQWPPHCCRSNNCDIQLTEVGQFPLIIGNNNAAIAASPQFDIKNLKMIRGTRTVVDMPFNQANGAYSLDYSETGTFGKLVNYNVNRSIGGGAWQRVD